MTDFSDHWYIRQAINELPFYQPDFLCNRCFGKLRSLDIF